MTNTTVTKPELIITLKGRLFLLLAVLSLVAAAFGGGYLYHQHSNLQYPTEDSYSVDYRGGVVYVTDRKPSDDTWCGQLKRQPAYTVYDGQGGASFTPKGTRLHSSFRKEGLRGSELRAACKAEVLAYRAYLTPGYPTS